MVSTMKKILCYCTIICILSTNLIITLAEDYTVVFDNNFENISLLPYNFKDKTPGISDGVVSIANCPVLKSNAIKLIDENNSSGFWLSGVAVENTFTPQNGEVIFNLSIVPMQENSHMNILLRDSKSGITGVNIQFVENGTIREYHNDSANSYVEIGKYKANKALNIRVEANIGKNTYSTYLDDKIVSENQEFYNRSFDSGVKYKKDECSNLNSIWIQGGVGVGEWYLDNMRMTSKGNTYTVPPSTNCPPPVEKPVESVETVVFDDDYTDATILPKDYFDRTESAAEGSITMESNSVTNANAIKINDLNKGSTFWLAGPALERTFEPQYAKFLLSIDVVLMQRTDHLNVMLYDKNNDVTGVNVQFIENGTLRSYHNDTDNTYSELGIFNQKTVVNLMMACDVKKNSYDLYIDGSLAEKNVDFQNRSLDNQNKRNIGDCKEINSIWIQSGLGVGEAFITDMKLSSFVGDIKIPNGGGDKPKVTALDIDEKWDEFESQYTDETKIVDNVYKRSDAIIDQFSTKAEHSIPISTVGDFYVSPKGNDDFSGKFPEISADGKDGPFATVQRAKEVVEPILATGMTKDITVLVRGGKYYLDKTVEFGLKDSGNNGFKVIYAAYPNEEPIFSSTKKIEGWKQLENTPPELPKAAKGKIMVADVPKNLQFKMLYDGTDILPRAKSNGMQIQNTSKEDMRDNQNFTFPEGALKNWDNLQDVEIDIIPYQSYVMNVLGLESVNVETNNAKTSLPAVYPIIKSAWPGPGGNMLPIESLWVENVLEYLDTPGEWVLNSKTGKLYLWPKENTEDIRYPTLVEYFKIEGDETNKIPAKDIVISGFTLINAERYTFTKDTITLQHEWEVYDAENALIRLRWADGITVENCKLYNSGSSGIRSDLYAQNISIYGNTIYNMGGSGIIFSGYGPGYDDVNHNNEIVNNYVHHVGLRYYSSCGIMLSQSGSNLLAHNEVHDTNHDGINLTGARSVSFDYVQFVPHCYERELYHTINHDAVGYDLRWDAILPFLYTKNNIVEYNHVYNFGKSLNDVNGIYVTGSGENNVVRRNYIHDGLRFGVVAGMRTDDLQRGTYMIENVINKTNYGSLQNKHRNYIMNNFFVGVQEKAIGPDGITQIPAYGYLTLDRGSVKGAVAYKNILYQPNGVVNFIIEGSTANMAANINDMYLNRNLYFSVDAAERSVRYLEYLRGRDREPNGMAADPLFNDIENNDFTFKEGSPAIEMEIRELDVRQWGRYKTPSPTFSDTNGHWAEYRIREVAEKNLMQGIDNTKFSPDSNITRVEFITIIARLLGLNERPYSNSFDDVNGSEWYANIVQAAYEANLINENMIVDNKLKPIQPITREEMTSLIVNAYETTGRMVKMGDLTQFNDFAKISDWVVPFVGQAYELNIVSGVTEDMFEPKAFATRAEAAVMISRLYDKMK